MSIRRGLPAMAGIWICLLELSSRTQPPRPAKAGQHRKRPRTAVGPACRRQGLAFALRSRRGGACPARATRASRVLDAVYRGPRRKLLLFRQGAASAAPLCAFYLSSRTRSLPSANGVRPARRRQGSAVRLRLLECGGEERDFCLGNCRARSILSGRRRPLKCGFSR